MAKSPSELAREVKSELDAFRSEFVVVRAEVERASLPQLRDRLTLLEERVGELKRIKEETDRRYWQIVTIGLAAVMTLIANIIINLILIAAKK